MPYLLIALVSVLLLPIVPSKWKGFLCILIVLSIACISSLPAIHALQGQNFETSFSGTSVTGNIPVRIDSLSAWFILIINFTFLTGALYGNYYLKAYHAQGANLSLHYIAYIFTHAALIGICCLQNSFVFLVVWEVMALGSFIVIIFDHKKQENLQAGINYLVQAHVCILALMVGFIWVAMHSGSFDFAAIPKLTSQMSYQGSLLLFLCFFFGFAIKAGFVPFHTWLPYAHPAAPSHVSGVMSGVIIKIGIYGILRMLLLIKTDFLILGYIILVISVISGIYGVMLAIVQHNLKKLLAYHSIENIGIIGIGIGLGCIGIGNGNTMLSLFGFSGALMHTLNHSLFKSMLFYTAGNVYQAAHTVNIEKLGGLVKKMPQTSILFLISALAICGLPPFNGFVSEFLIYNGMFSGLKGGGIVLFSSLILSVFGLVLIGGLALMCFTKAFGTVFLGVNRSALPQEVKDGEMGKMLPIYLGTSLIISIGLFPQYFMGLISNAVGLFAAKGKEQVGTFLEPAGHTLASVGLFSGMFISMAAIIYLLKRLVTQNKQIAYGPTWGCGYVGGDSKLQYTASSFVRSFRKLAGPVLSIQKRKKIIQGIFPVSGSHETHPYDRTEEILIDVPLKWLKQLFNRFAFLQNGNPQSYVLYGIVFIVLIMIIPALIDSINFISHLFMQF